MSFKIFFCTLLVAVAAVCLAQAQAQQSTTNPDCPIQRTRAALQQFLNQMRSQIGQAEEQISSRAMDMQQQLQQLRQQMQQQIQQQVQRLSPGNTQRQLSSRQGK